MGLEDDREGRVRLAGDPLHLDPSPGAMLKTAIDEVLQNSLSYRQREVIKERYGLEDGFRFTREQVRRIFKLQKRHTVGKIEKTAKRKLWYSFQSPRFAAFQDFLCLQGPTQPEGYCHLLEDVLGPAEPIDARPNLFHFATSELSQDAFICWLVAWGAYGRGDINQPLHQTGVFFLNSLLSLHDLRHHDHYWPLKIVPRYKGGIDILVELFKGYPRYQTVLLIEDKVDHNRTEGQLESYLETVGNDYEGWTVAPVFLKTGDEDHDAGIEAAGYKHFRRRELLKVLAYGKRHGVDSDVFNDFHAHLLEKHRASWKNETRRLRFPSS